MGVTPFQQRYNGQNVHDLTATCDAMHDKPRDDRTDRSEPRNGRHKRKKWS